MARAIVAEPTEAPSTEMDVDGAEAERAPTEDENERPPSDEAERDGSPEPEANGRRASKRQRKPVKRLVEEGKQTRRQKATVPADDDEPSEEEDELDEDHDSDESVRPAAVKRRRSGAAKPRTSAPRKRARKSAANRGAGSDDEQPLGLAEYNISPDNPLFNAVRDPQAAVQSAVDDWIATYQEDEDEGTGPGTALAQLVNFMLRACGCSASIDRHEAQDLEGATARLDEIQDDFQKIGTRAYPLVARKQAATAFRKSLADFVARLIDATHTAEILYDDVFCESFQSWLVAATSSHLRSFRHTATIIALDLVSAICSTAASVTKAFAAATRQRDAEAKKARVDKAKLKSYEERIEETHRQKVALETYLGDLFDGVWVHRYRDAEPAIRSECIRALGQWMRGHPDHYLSGDFLRYVGWILTDPSKEARLEAVRSLAALYGMEDYVGTLQHFTERFKGRLVEMAEAEVDLSVRCAAIEVLRAIDKHGLLEDEQRDSLARLVFSAEPRVRKSAAAFFGTLVEDAVEQRTPDLQAIAGGAGKADREREQAARLELRVLAALLVEHGSAVGMPAGVETEVEDEGEAATARTELPLISSDGQSRIDMAIEVLAAHIGPIEDAQTLIDYLLVERDELEDALKPDEAEEVMLVSILVAVARKVVADAAVPSKKAEADEDETVAELTRALIKALPRLIARYQSDEVKIADVLALVPLLSLELYLDLRMITAYETLWDDVARQFTSHKSPATLDAALGAIRKMLATVSLGKSNATKVAELELALIEALREAAAGKQLETTAFDDEDRDALAAWLARLARLATVHDVAPAIEDTGGLRYTSAWTIVDALADRGRLGFADEDGLIESALGILGYYTLWSGRSADEDLDAFRARRAELVERLTDLAFGEASNATEAVRRAAFVRLLELYVIYGPRAGTLALVFPEEAQFRCAGFIQSEIERTAEALGGDVAAEDEDEDDEDEPAKRKAKAPVTPKSAKQRRPRTLAQLASGHVFAATITAFARAVRVGVIELRHAAVLLAHVNRFAAPFDECARYLADALREAAVYGEQGGMVATVVIDALREAHSLYIDGTVATDDQLLALARQLGSAIVVRGAHLSIAARIDSDALVRIHVESLTDALTKAAASDDSPARAVTLFKALALMLAGLTGREALEIQTKMDAAIAGAGIASTAGKAWDPQRAYAKRLATAMSKDASIKQAARDKAAEMGPPAVPKRKAKAKPKKAAAAADDDDDADVAAPRVRHNPRPSRHQPPPPPVVNEDEDEPASAPASSPSKRKRASPAPQTDEDETGADAEGRAREPSPTPSDASAAVVPPKRRRIV